MGSFYFAIILILWYIYINKKVRVAHMENLKDYTFKQFVENIEALREQYSVLLSPFFNEKLIRCWRTMIFSLQIDYWKRERLWEVLNYDEDVELLYKLI
jgi:hypothetical protein